MRRLEVECRRCGDIQIVERAGRFRDDDFLELWHEYAELEQRYRRDVARLTLRLNSALRDLGFANSLAENWQFLAEHEAATV